MAGVSHQALLASYGVAAAAASFVDSGSSASDLSTYSFSGRSLGAAAPDRVIYVAVWTRDSGTTATISSVSIGGNAATKVGVGVKNTSGGNTGLLEWWAIAAGSGSALEIATTATVAVTFSEGVLRAAIAVYRKVGGAYSLTPASSYQSMSDDPSVSIEVPDRGAAIAAAAGDVDTATSATWTGLLEDLDIGVETNRPFTAASGNFATAQSGLTVQASWGAPQTSAVLECLVLV